MMICNFEIPSEHYLAGQWCQGQGKLIEVKNKFSQEVLGSFREWEGDTSKECSTLLSAQKGYALLKKYSAGERRKLLENFLQVFKKNEKKLIDLVVAEAGKPLNYAQAEVARCQSTLMDAIEESSRIGGEVVPMDFSIGTGRRAFTQLMGAGIVLAISPFNFPLNLAMHKIAPAIAAGCPVILRPSPFTPFCALAMAKIVQEAGWPGEIFQVVNSSIPATQAMVEDTRIRILSFTGSDKVGWHLRDLAKSKQVLLELGGNAAVYVDKETPIGPLVKQLVSGSFLYAGQICISTQRIYAHADIYQELQQQLLEAVKQIKVGDPMIAENLYGPVIDSVALDRIHSTVEKDVSRGATVLCGGEILNREQNIYAPTILANTTEEMDIHKKEIFAPVVSLDKVSSFEQACTRINDSIYGLQAGVFTQNISVMKQAFQNLDVGAVILNNVPGFRMDNMPYGGVKSSGLGREGARYSIKAYSEEKLCIF